MPDLKRRNAFTIAEVLLASVVGMFVIGAVICVYMMTWRWWAEISPRLDAQRAARLALLNVIEGVTGIASGPDPVAGAFTVGSTAYKRRNGIAWATAYPTISADNKSIDYRLVPDSSNTRRFYLVTDSVTGIGTLYYKHSSGASYAIPSTRGLSDIKFEKFTDAGGTAHDNIIKVTATAEKNVAGTRPGAGLDIKVVYTDTVYLRNAL
jgi:hypothetical protein